MRQPIMSEPRIDVFSIAVTEAPSNDLSVFVADRFAEVARPGLHLNAEEQAQLKEPLVTPEHEKIGTEVMAVVRSNAPPEALERRRDLAYAKAANLFGAARLADLVSAATCRWSRPMEDDVRSVLARHSDAEFLDGSWFWLPSQARNGLVKLTRRILAVASPLDVLTIRAGVCRACPHRQADLVPPASVMRAMYEAHDEFTVDRRGLVHPSTELDSRAELSRCDRIFVGALRSSWTGVLDRAELHDACIGRGMSTHSFNRYTTCSAVLDHPASDAWCLRGTRTSHVTVAALRYAKGRKPPERRLVSSGWNGEGVFRMAVVVPPVHRSLVVQVPSQFARHVAGRRFPAFTGDGSQVGTIALNSRGPPGASSPPRQGSAPSKETW